MKTIALISMLHETAAHNSATRLFRGEPVLAWTLRRLARAQQLDTAVIAVWADQFDTVEHLTPMGYVQSFGPRQAISSLDTITTAQKWADGWRGGLFSTCSYDRGFVASVVKKAMADHDAEAAVLIDPASALVDCEIIDRLVETAAAGPRDYYFTQAPPGLAGVLLKQGMVARLSEGVTHPGRVVHYLPDAPVLDPVTSDACVALPLSVSRSTQRFLFDSGTQVDRLAAATEPLNGTLISTGAEGLAERLRLTPRAPLFPREITVELTTQRHSRPVFAPVTHLPIHRPAMTLDLFDKIVAEAARFDDLRITLAGAGDPLAHPQFLAFLDRCAALPAVSIETDLLNVSGDVLAAIGRSRVDVLSVHLPAMSPSLYQQVMGVDALTEVVQNIRQLLAERQAAGQSTPLLAPIFMKLAINLDEMEHWYDTWMRAVGSAVIVGPSDYAGRIPDTAAANMTPPLRKPCARIQSRLTILSDGAIVMCEQDVRGDWPVGHLAGESIGQVWGRSMGIVREAHASLTSLPVLCGDCREWDRP